MGVGVTQLPNARQQFFNADGPLVGGKVYTFIPGTTVPKATYQDNLGVAVNQNPIPLDAIGSAAIWGNGTYREQVFDSAGNLVFDAVAGGGGVQAGINVTDYTTIQLADAAAAAAGQALIFPPGQANLTTSYTLQSSCTFIQGATLNVSSGQVATFTYPIIASPNYQIFTGPGSVVGIRDVYPEWWGAKGNGIADDILALEAAEACIQGSSGSFGIRPTINLLRSRYAVSRTWTTRPTADVGPHYRGAGIIFSGVRIVPKAGFTGTAVWWIRGNTDSTQQIADWKLTDIGIVGTPSTIGTSLYGLLIGSDPVAPVTGELLLGLAPNLVENIFVQGFLTNIECSADTLVCFRRGASWNQGSTVPCNNLVISVNNNVASDMTFTDGFQCVAPIGVSGAGNVALRANLHQFGFPPVINQLAGIKFDRCDFYQGDRSVQLLSGAGAELTDIWFTSCQWDGTSDKMLYIESDSVPSLVQDVHISHNYFNGASVNTASVAIDCACVGTGGFMRNIFITDNWFANGTGVGILLFSLLQTLRGVTIKGNQFDSYSFTAGSVMEIAGVYGAVIEGNLQSKKDGQPQVTTYMIDIQAAGGPSLGNDYITCYGNNGSGIPTGATINDLSGSIHKSVTGNI